MDATGTPWNVDGNLWHVLSVSEVVERALLIDDPDGGFLGADAHGLDVLCSLPELLELVMDDVGGLDGGLGVELGREGDLEENVLHDVRAVGALELEGLALSRDVRYTESRGSNGGRVP